MRKRAVDDFLESLAAATPTPGGGTASAFAGALSVALSRMVAGLAVGKEGYEAVQGELQALVSRARALQDRLVDLMEEDARAYDDVVAAMRRPRGTDAERAARVDAMQAAYRRATEVPLDTMAACVEALELAEAVAEKGNRAATTDAGVAILLAESGLRGASLNGRVNLASIKDEGFRERSEARMRELLAKADAVGHRAMALVESRL